MEWSIELLTPMHYMLPICKAYLYMFIVQKICDHMTIKELGYIAVSISTTEAFILS